MTDIVSVGPGAVATQVVAAGDGETLVINTGPGTVFFGDNNAIRAADATGVVPISPLSYMSVTGEKDLYACVFSGQRANLNVISGGLNFFLPLTSLTIPYGATGARVVINPPSDPGAIVGYDDVGNVTFVLDSNGMIVGPVVIDSTGLTVGPATGPQVKISGGNPAVISMPLNDSSFLLNPVINATITSGPPKFASMILDGPTANLASHRDYVELQFNSANLAGNSFANMGFVWYNGSVVGPGNQPTYMGFMDGTGISIGKCSGLQSTKPGTGTDVFNPAQTETWHSIGTFPSGITGSYRYKMVAETNCILVDISVTWPSTAPATFVFPLIPAPYTPSTPGGLSRIYTMQGNVTPAAVSQIARLFINSSQNQILTSASTAGGTASWTGIIPID